jgi:hypothetical protein
MRQLPLTVVRSVLTHWSSPFDQFLDEVRRRVKPGREGPVIKTCEKIVLGLFRGEAGRPTR